MATRTDIPPLGAEIRTLLAQLRRRIRVYVWLEGFALAIFWLGLTFWIGLAIDYLPVLVGASEMPRSARGVLLVIIGAILAWVIYQWILRRVFARLPDHSMALLLERRFQRFHDGLVTAVEVDERPERAAHFNPEMLLQTARQAESLTGNVRIGDVFRWTPLTAKMLMALAVIVPIGVLYAVNAQAVEIWVNRLYLLKDEPWPRGTHIEVAGIQIQRVNPTDGSTVLSPVIPFDDNREIKVAKGTSVIVKTRADAAKIVPEYCLIYYDTQDDQSGRVTMQKLGRIRNNVQLYVFDGKPFRGILSSIRFDVRGMDHRVRDYRLTVVPSPAIIETQLDCTFPEYMVNEDLSLWMPRTIPLASGTQLPNGTQIKIRVRSNKDLVRVDIHNPETDKTETIDLAADGRTPRVVEYRIARIEGAVVLEWTLHDTDGVSNDPPYRMSILGIEDQPPSVDVTLSGIGTAVTPNVLVPAQGKIKDDYDVNRAWFEATVNDGKPREFPFPLKRGGQVASELDFRALRSATDGLILKPKDKLILAVKASDQCDLGEAPNIGSGDRYQLDVVTPDELLTMLERRELGLRRRFEQIIDEVNQMQDSLGRVRRDSSDPRAVAPEDAREKKKTESANKAAPAAKPSDGNKLDMDPDQRAESLRLLHTQRAIVQSQKSAQEILGVAASFHDIRKELINNRVDTEDRKIRLKDQIADPLQLVGETMFPELDRLLELLETKLSDPKTADKAVDLAVQQTDDILVELDKILQKMLELETYNELVNLVRSLLEEQKTLTEQTKKERVKQARDLLK